MLLNELIEIDSCVVGQEEDDTRNEKLVIAIIILTVASAVFTSNMDWLYILGVAQRPSHRSSGRASTALVFLARAWRSPDISRLLGRQEARRHQSHTRKVFVYP